MQLALVIPLSTLHPTAEACSEAHPMLLGAVVVQNSIKTGEHVARSS